MRLSKTSKNQVIVVISFFFSVLPNYFGRTFFLYLTDDSHMRLMCFEIMYCMFYKKATCVLIKRHVCFFQKTRVFSDGL